MRSTEDGQRGFAPGTVLGDRFRIVRAIGAGGMGIVYEAADLKLDRHVALKCGRAGHRYRITPEARAAREVSHFNVCKVHDLHTFETADGEIDCLSMEYIEGETLSQRIRRDGRLGAAEAAEIARQICAGLTQAHRQGVIHGDLKGGNVILSRSPEGKLRAVITDFGLARLSEETHEEARNERHAQGTHDYMAPEIFLGEPATVASDIYALGVMFHVMLTGRAPRRLKPIPELPSAWNPNSRETTRTTGHGFVESDWLRDVEPLPAPWKKIVTRCVAPRADRRFASAAAVGKALEPRRALLKLGAAAVAAAVLVFAGREWRNFVPATPVRLAVLPFVTEGDRVDTLAGVGLEVTERLSGARRKFIVISPREAERNQATTIDKARTILGATHALDTRVRVSGGSIETTASLVELKSGRTLGELHGTYATADAQVLAKALVATVTEAFHLAAPKESVSAAAYPYYVQGIDLLRLDDAAYAEQAIRLLTRATEIDPKSALTFAGLAEAQIQRAERGDGVKWLDEAEATAAKATIINPDAVPVLLASGFLQQQRGHYEQALRLLTRATEVAPQEPEAWRRLAQCYERANRLDEALATYHKAIEAQPDYYRYHLSLGTLFFNRGQFSRAEEEYRKTVDIAPALASGHMNLGLALMQEGNFRDAEGQLLEALKLRSSLNLLINVAALYYEEGRFEESANYFERSLQEGLPSAMQYRGLGDANRHLGRVKESQTGYERARDLVMADVTRNPRRAASHSLLGLVDAFLKDRARATFELSQALALDPENRSVMRDAAIAYEFLGQRDDAIAALQKAPRPLLDELSRQPDVKGLQSDSRFQALLSKTPAQ